MKTSLLALMRPHREVALSIGGFVAVDVAAFLIAAPLGWLTLGLSCWVLEWRLSE
jgi:hypothetical protein